VPSWPRAKHTSGGRTVLPILIQSTLAGQPAGLTGTHHVCPRERERERELQVCCSRGPRREAEVQTERKAQLRRIFTVLSQLAKVIERGKTVVEQRSAAGTEASNFVIIVVDVI